MVKIDSSKVTPFLWFNNQAQEASKFYISIFKNSKILSSSPMIVTFKIENQKFMALNGGPTFKFNEAVSFYVNCKNQKEVNYFWGKLSKSGKKGQCGWLKDKYGLSWQIVPDILGKLMTDNDELRSNSVMQAMLKMKKLEIKGLNRAFNRKPNQN